MEKSKVSFFGPVYGIGGAGHVCSDIGKELAHRGYEVDFLVDGRYRDDSYLREDLPEQASIVRYTDASSDPQSRFNLRYYAELFVGLTQYLQSQDQLTLLSNGTKYNILAVWASVLSGATNSLVLIEHNLLTFRASGPRRILPPMVRLHYPRANHVVGVSKDITEEFITDYSLDPSRCTTIENPIDTRRIRSMGRESVSHPWFSGDAPLILGVGRFVDFKRFSLLLSALARMPEGVRLVLIGEGPLEADLKQQSNQLGIEDRVEFLGFTDNPYKYMWRADVLAHSSRAEGFGLVLVEALACGTPVVATDCPGGPSDILQDGEYGLLVDVGNPEALANAIADTLEHSPNSDRLVERAKDFDVSKVTDRYERIISQS